MLVISTLKTFGYIVVCSFKTVFTDRVDITHITHITHITVILFLQIYQSGDPEKKLPVVKKKLIKINVSKKIQIRI